MKPAADAGEQNAARNPTAETMPMAASPYNRALSVSFSIASELNATIGMET